MGSITYRENCAQCGNNLPIFFYLYIVSFLFTRNFLGESKFPFLLLCVIACWKKNLFSRENISWNHSKAPLLFATYIETADKTIKWTIWHEIFQEVTKWDVAKRNIAKVWLWTKIKKETWKSWFELTKIYQEVGFT